MKRNLIKYIKCALGMGVGIAIGQLLFTSEQPFDVFRPIFVGVLTALVVFAFDQKRQKAFDKDSKE